MTFSRAPRASRALLVVGAILCALPLWSFRNASLDDPFISYRYAQNLVAGHGLVWNVGEPPVEGYTNLGWVLLNAIAIRAGFQPLLFSKLVGACCSIALLLLLLSPLNRVTKTFGGKWAAVLCVGIAPASAFYALSGMETAIFTLVATAALLCFTAFLATERPKLLFVSSLLLGFAVLIRPEAALFFAALVAFLLVEQPGRLTARLASVLSRFGAYLLPFVIVLSAQLAWRFSYYGDFVPNSYRAKYAANGLAERLMGFIYVADGFRAYLALPLAGVLFGHFAGAHEPQSLQARQMRALTIVLGIYLAYLVVIGRDDTAAFPSFRFFVPILPAAYLLYFAALERARAVTSAWVIPAWLGLTIVSLLPEGVALARQADITARPLAGVASAHSRKPELAEWIERTTPPDGLIAAPWAGRLPYYTNRRFVDTLGLNDAHIARQAKRQRGVNVKTDPKYVVSRRPDLVFINVDPDVARGLKSFEAGGGWRAGDKELIQILNADRRYELEASAPVFATVFRLKQRDTASSAAHGP